MKLLALEIDCIKNVQRDKNLQFNAESKESFDGFLQDPNYADFINNVMIDINQAMSRLVSSEKLDRRTIVYTPTEDETIKKYKVQSGAYIIDRTSDTSIDWETVYRIKNIYLSTSEEVLRQVHFKLIHGNKKILITPFSYKGSNPTFYIEYTINIPRLSHDLDYDVDLYETYSISDNMCYSYILNFVKAKLWEEEQPKLAQQYMNYAEAFLNDFVVENSDSEVVQTEVKNEINFY
jgi:hypothetical protein